MGSNLLTFYIFLTVLSYAKLLNILTNLKTAQTASVVLWPQVRKIMGLSPDQVKPKTIKLVFVGYSLST